jgi:hypothetical protein
MSYEYGVRGMNYELEVLRYKLHMSYELWKSYKLQVTNSEF